MNARQAQCLVTHPHPVRLYRGRVATDNQVLALLIERVRPRMLEYFTRDSCVAATRIGLDLCDAFGIHAKPIPVTMTALNREYLAIPGLPDEEREALWSQVAAGAVTANTPGGPWRVDVNSPDAAAADEGAGHVVIGVPATPSHPTMLIDVSADQADRPHKNIHIPQPIATIPDSAFLTTVGAQHTVALDDGGAVVYQRTSSRTYTRSPNWRRTSTQPDGRAVFRQLTANLIAEFRDELAART